MEAVIARRFRRVLSSQVCGIVSRRSQVCGNGRPKFAADAKTAAFARKIPWYSGCIGVVSEGDNAMPQFKTLDANEAVAAVAYQLSEVIAIYPITPSSAMGEWSDQWSADGKPNLWGITPRVVEMQSEGGAAGALHGALQAGALATTFTASQGLMLMLPNMFKIAGELTPCVIHVAARSLAAQGLSIFCDHQDVMAARMTGYAMLCSSSVQEAADFAVISHAATLESRIPFMHFFDGFRTSHEVQRIMPPTRDLLRAMISDELIAAHRARALSPDHPVIRGTAQNPDVYFQARESVNPFYLATPTIVQNTMDEWARLTGRQYHLFDYVGAPDAEVVIVMMGSGSDATHEAVDALVASGRKVGVVKVRLFRPFDAKAFLGTLPPTTKTLVVLDRTKEPGSLGEPLYLEVLAALNEGSDLRPRVIGGRYGLSSKEFTPAMAKAVFDEGAKPQPKRHFTIGINDDVTHLSLDFDPDYSTEDPHTVRAVFFGLGADGTVGANKNSIKIIGEETDNYAQGYFVYDSKKSGSTTTSHLRFGPRPIRSSYLIQRASFVACHQFGFLDRIDMLKVAEPGATFLLNSPFGPDSIWQHLPQSVQKDIISKKLKFFVVDALKVAHDAGMGGRINTVMQTCFFALSGVLPHDEAIDAIKTSIEKTYGKRGRVIVEKNWEAVDASLAHLHQVAVPDRVEALFDRRPAVSDAAPEFVRHVTSLMMVGEGDSLPVSALPSDGTWPTGTSKWEKRNIADEIPIWDESICIQCGKCVLVCPHAAIRAKLATQETLEGAPSGFKTAPARWADHAGELFTLQVAPEDCTGCKLCVEVCPVKSKSMAGHKAINMAPQPPLREGQMKNWEFFDRMPYPSRDHLRLDSVKDVQLFEPLFEFSGACAGCGETPYLKLLTQLYGDRLLIANATGCSSIYGGNLPTTPYAANAEGRGPAWSNSLFEDNAEFGLGMRLAVDKQADIARALVSAWAGTIGEELSRDLLNADQHDEAGINAQRGRVAELKRRLASRTEPDARNLIAVADALVRKSVWIVGGDGWAYDIGFGGLDHVLASGEKINVLVLDTEVYSNTGGQMSKSTPRAAVAKFAAGGKKSAKKDLALAAMMYGHIYVARVAMGASDSQTLQAFREAEAYPGPSLIIAYSHCIAHGFDMCHGMDHQKAAVQSGSWPLLRYNPANADMGKNPLHLDSRPPTIPLASYFHDESRYTMLEQAHPAEAHELFELAQHDVQQRLRLYESLAHIQTSGPSKE
jgi:pyruvate-ferredoxin/flavodoxin oxidoreductase